MCPSANPRAALGAVAPLLASLLLAGCAAADAPVAGTPSAPTPSVVSGSPGGGTPGTLRGAGPDRGVFLPYTVGATAVTYDPAAVPPGATAEVVVLPAADGVTVRLAVTGMVPRRTYGAHLHVRPCGAAPEDAGPHHQHIPDPKAVASAPSVDPRFANPRNEVWLDFTADVHGAAVVTAEPSARFNADRRPRSLVVHGERTKTAHGSAGMAGPRVACLTLPD